MTEDLNKEITTAESDPQSLDEHRSDPPGSFMDVYRSIAPAHAAMDEQFVEYAVIERVIPATVRYGVMERGLMKAYRGVIKDLEGSMFYFNFAEGGRFKLVKADDKTKVWEANKLLKSCTFGCDLNRSNTVDAPIDPGEAVSEEDEDDTEKELSGNAGVAPISEEQYVRQQQRVQTEVHPGSTHSALPDDPAVGRDWHKSEPQQPPLPEDPQQGFAKASDGMTQVATNDGEKHWSTNDLMKAWGDKLQATAPRVAPKVSPLEGKYLKEVLGVTSEQLEKGMTITPRHRLGYEQWRTTQLRGQVTGLQDWLNKQGG